MRPRKRNVPHRWPHRWRQLSVLHQPALEPFSDADFRNDLKAFVSGEIEVLSDAGLPHMTLSVCETDYPLLCYATALCERLTAAGADVTLKQYSETMLRSVQSMGGINCCWFRKIRLMQQHCRMQTSFCSPQKKWRTPHAKTEHHSLRSATFHLSASWADGQFYVAGHQFRGRESFWHGSALAFWRRTPSLGFC